MRLISNLSRWVVLLCILLLSACSTSPTGRTQLAFMADAEVDSMGLQAFENLKKEKKMKNRESNVSKIKSTNITYQT